MIPKDWGLKPDRLVPSGFFMVRTAAGASLVTVSAVQRNWVKVIGRREAVWSVNREPMSKNRMEGVAKQGERA